MNWNSIREGWARMPLSQRESFLSKTMHMRFDLDFADALVRDYSLPDEHLQAAPTNIRQTVEDTLPQSGFQDTITPRPEYMNRARLCRHPELGWFVAIEQATFGEPAILAWENCATHEEFQLAMAWGNTKAEELFEHIAQSSSAHVVFSVDELLDEL